MFQLIDGREYLWQWDINRQVKVEDPAIDEVHFCNRTSDCSLVVEVKDGVADIPNILLQQDFPIKVYAYLKDGYTKIEECLKIKSRTKPSDYIYTETEVITVQTIEKRMDELEERVDLKIDEVDAIFVQNIDGAVNNYLDEHPIDPSEIPIDLSDYYTKEEVDSANYQTEAKANLQHIDLRNSLAAIINLLSIKSGQELSYTTKIPWIPGNRILTDFASQLKTAGICQWNGENNTYLSYKTLGSSINGVFIVDASGNITDKGMVVGADLYTNHIYILQSAYIFDFESSETLTSAIANNLSYNNIESGLTATTIKGAIDELASRPSGEGQEVDLTNYYTKAEVDEAIENIDLSGCAEKVHFHTTAEVTGLDTYVDNRVAAHWQGIGKVYVDKVNGDIQEAVLEILGLPEEYESTIIGDIAQTLTDAKAYTDEAIANIEIPDVSNYQTEAQVNALINTALGVIENGTY